MSNTFICDSKKYQLGGPKEDTIGLPVVISSLPDMIDVEGYTLVRRTAFHVSLVCIGKIIEQNNVSIPNFKEKMIEDFCEFVKEKPITFIGCREEFRFVSQNERRSVVVMCDISNLSVFFDFFNKKYGLNIEYPPTHITLFTLQKDTGIFLVSIADIDKLTKIIPKPSGIDRIVDI